MSAVNPLNTTVTVSRGPAEAFALFAERMITWWPPEYTWAQDALQHIGVESRAGGRCTELGPHDFQADWGRVLVWTPPHRLVLAWQISPRRAPEPDPTKASEVDVRFESAGTGSTEVTLQHRHFERHGPEGQAYRDAMASAQGWPWILQRFAEAAG